jgi:competence protein ComEC
MSVKAGDIVLLSGVSDGVAGALGSSSYRATVEVVELRLTGRRESSLLTLGDAVHDHVVRRLAPLDGGRALLAGFLIGDTSGVEESDLEAMRRSGLAHFVAVSGSNIALLLGLLAVVTGPLGWTPRRRAIVGLLALPVYAAATRFEPSVLRASVMAGLVLIGRLMGVLLEAWQLLALAVTLLLVSRPELSASVGFQLSVAATGGVLAGGRWPVTGGKIQRAFAVGLGAQLGVAPILLGHFGAVPLLSPLVNLVTAPLVAMSTIIGAVGVSGPGWLVPVASWTAELVLMLARGASTWPQVGALPLAGGLLVAVVIWRRRRLRPLVVVGASIALVVWVFHQGQSLPESGAVFLDVGQGDAVILSGGDGEIALIDGGPDPVRLVQGLREYGVTSLDLVVATHVHADHTTGLVALVGRYPIGEVWHVFEPHTSPSASELLEALEEHGVPTTSPSPGDTRALGSLTLRVVGPIRRYESANDQSIVIEVLGPGRTMLLTGDIEKTAQADLGHLEAEVVKVPHHGSGTSDPMWLESVGAELAIIPVGENDFGHPVEWVVETLEISGATVLRTDQEGDILVDLGR